MTGRELLADAGTISHQSALEKAHTKYELFKQNQLKEPSAVEKDFIAAEKKIKQLGSLKEQDDKKTK